MYNPIPLAVFILTIFLVFKHPLVRIPFTSKYIHLDYGWAPLLGVLILVLTLSAGPDVIFSGIFGSDSLKPYSVLILIISLSYICISLECSGFFEYVSLKVVKKAGLSGRKLFLLIFLLTTGLTLFANNDIIILTMTFIVMYIARTARVDPLPFLFAQFFAVNIAGMALYIGNPTNIVVADATGISFVEYAKWMLIPSFASAATCFVVLWLLFGKRVPKKLDGFEINSFTSLKDKEGAAFGLISLILVIFMMSLPTSYTGFPVWASPLIFALLLLLRDFIRHRSGVSGALSKVPWRIVPFLIGFFIIIKSLASAGWVSSLASAFSLICTTTFGAVFGMCLFSSLAACVMNNHPMVISFVEGLQGAALSPGHRLAASLAVITGSNFGANLTLIGALAGMMWAGILEIRGQTISFSTFSKYGFAVMLPTTMVACSVLAAELIAWGEVA